MVQCGGQGRAATERERGYHTHCIHEQVNEMSREYMGAQLMGAVSAWMHAILEVAIMRKERSPTYTVWPHSPTSPASTYGTDTRTLKQNTIGI